MGVRYFGILIAVIFSLFLINEVDAFNITINEVMYNPEGDDDNKEYVELFLNNFSNLDGYIIQDENSQDELELIQLLNSSYALIVEEYFNYTGINASIYSAGAAIGNNLNNNRDNITIKNSYGTVFDHISYNNLIGADNNGMSLCRLNNSWYECNPTPGYDNTEGIVGNYTVNRVIDGDTVVLSNNERVRLIGINTPESGRFYYEEARDRLIELAEGKNVTLERDVENIDIYNRLLRYIYINNTFVNLILVEEGYARAYPFEPNIQYKKEFYEAERTARYNKAGMWVNVPNITILNPEDNSIIRTHSFWLNITTDQNSTCYYAISFSRRIPQQGNLPGIVFSYTSSFIPFDFSNEFNHSQLITDDHYSNTDDSLNEIYDLNVKCINEEELFSLQSIHFTVDIPEYDNLMGDIDDIQTDINLTLEIGNLTNGTRNIIFREENRTLIHFNFNFTNSMLNLSNIMIQKQTNNNSGSIIVGGINLTDGNTKTVYVDDLNENTDTVCIKDAEISSIEEISTNCDGEDEYLITCNGNNYNNYTCIDKGDEYKITGLMHSGIIEKKVSNNNGGENSGDNPGGRDSGRDSNDNSDNEPDNTQLEQTNNAEEPENAPEEAQDNSNEITSAITANLGTGSVIVLAILIVGIGIYFLLRRKK